VHLTASPVSRKEQRTKAVPRFRCSDFEAVCIYRALNRNAGFCELRHRTTGLPTFGDALIAKHGLLRSGTCAD
jgi:hypothetical protein